MSVRGPARPRWTDGRRGRADAGPSLRRLRRARPRPAFRGFPDGVHPLVVDSLRGAQLQALYAWSPPGGPAPVSRAQDEADAKHRRALQEWLAPLRQEYPDVEVVEELAHESPVLALARASDLSDLLVVGTCGRGGFRGLALGSVSHAPPVLHVPHGGHPSAHTTGPVVTRPPGVRKGRRAVETADWQFIVDVLRPHAFWGEEDDAGCRALPRPQPLRPPARDCRRDLHLPGGRRPRPADWQRRRPVWKPRCTRSTTSSAA
ncbi:universal stress protein [Streptomyces mirabilis]|uniref:universal stress protein n=1 Tax=Streptomyces mirabilis TaxID=68239 RepID=UPI003327DC2A